MVKNKGYTLMELIIVIAIMAILSGLSLVTVGIINEARRSSAVTTFDNQISSCLIRTKAVSDVNKPLCMVIKKRTDDTYAIVSGTIDGAGVNIPDVEVDDNCEAILAKQISKIVYTESDTNQKHTFVSDDQWLIQFVKSDGSVQYGAGKYEFYTIRSGTESLYATISVDAVTGNHRVE